MLLNAQHAGNIVGGESSDDAGNERVVLQEADIADLHGDDGSGKRRAEQRGESRAHAGHDHDAAGAVRKMEPLAELIPDTAADLQRSAFAAYGSSQEMGGNGGAEDQRRHRAGDALAPCHGEKDRIRAFAPVELLVEEDDERRSAAPTGIRKMTHGCAARSSVAASIPRAKMLATTPTSVPHSRP